MFFQVFKSGYLSSCWNFSIPLGFFFFLEKERLHDVRMKEKKTKKKWMKERMNDLVAEWISEWIDYYLQVLQQSELNWTRALYIIIYEKKKKQKQKHTGLISLMHWCKLYMNDTRLFVTWYETIFFKLI